MHTHCSTKGGHRLGRYRVLEASEETVSSIAWEILTARFSKKLREEIYRAGGIQRKQRGP